MAKIKIAKTVKELETKYKVKKGKAERYSVNKENIPAEFWMLLPYLEYYCVYHQEEREAFCEKLPEVAFQDLDEILESLEPEPGLVSWLGGAEAKRKKLTDEYLALTILVEVCDNNISYHDDSPPELTAAEKERVAYILTLNEQELRTVWKIQPDTFQRIDFDASKLPSHLQPLKSILNIVAMPARGERDAFEQKNTGLIKKDLELVKRFFKDSADDFCAAVSSNIRMTKGKREGHESAIDLLRVIY
jgi:hypothetical protein